MKKLSKKEKSGLFFSAFLIIAYIICSLFFDQYISYIENITVQNILRVIIYAVFGIALFYGTRIGDGKAVYRFSLITLIILVLPSLYIILAYFAVGLPLHTQIVDSGIIVVLSAVTFGYGLPYTFVSGFEKSLPEEDSEINGFEELSENNVELDIDKNSDVGDNEDNDVDNIKDK